MVNGNLYKHSWLWLIMEKNTLHAYDKINHYKLLNDINCFNFPSLFWIHKCQIADDFLPCDGLAGTNISFYLLTVWGSSWNMIELNDIQAKKWELFKQNNVSIELKNQFLFQLCKPIFQRAGGQKVFVDKQLLQFSDWL